MTTDFDFEDDNGTMAVAYEENLDGDRNDAAVASARVADETDMRNIVRYGPGAGSGWRVAIGRQSPLRVYGRTFVDAQHGGAAGALAAAQDWRDAIEKRYPGQPRSRRSLSPEASNVSGVTGVYRIIVWRPQPDGGRLPEYLWRAITPSAIVPRRCRVFSVTRYGEEEAKRLAVAARRAFEADAETVVFEPPSPELRGISRVERKLFGIWLVTLSRSTAGRSQKKPFSDLLHGDKERALAAAQAWRDEMERRYRERGRLPVATRSRPPNADSVAGVYRQRYVCRHADGSESAHYYWQARTPKGLKPGQSRTFYVSKYGEREAYRLAVEARKAFERTAGEAADREGSIAKSGS